MPSHFWSTLENNSELIMHGNRKSRCSQHLLYANKCRCHLNNGNYSGNSSEPCYVRTMPEWAELVGSTHPTCRAELQSYFPTNCNCNTTECPPVDINYVDDDVTIIDRIMKKVPGPMELTRCIDRVQHAVLVKVRHPQTSLKLMQNLFSLKKVLLCSEPGNCKEKKSKAHQVAHHHRSPSVTSIAQRSSDRIPTIDPNDRSSKSTEEDIKAKVSERNMQMDSTSSTSSDSREKRLAGTPSENKLGLPERKEAKDSKSDSDSSKIKLTSNKEAEEHHEADASKSDSDSSKIKLTSNKEAEEHHEADASKLSLMTENASKLLSVSKDEVKELYKTKAENSNSRKRSEPVFEVYDWLKNTEGGKDEAHTNPNLPLKAEVKNAKADLAINKSKPK